MKLPRDSGVGEAKASPYPAGSRAQWDFGEGVEAGAAQKAVLTDADLDAPPLSLQESLDAGWITAGEKRRYEGTATEADLAEAGYSIEEIREILKEQQDRARTPST